jgi:hypothetical protein
MFPMVLTRKAETGINPRVAVSRGLRRSNGRNSADLISDALPRALNSQAALMEVGTK